MRMRTLILIGVAATLQLSFASPQDKVNLPSTVIEESTKKVKELQKERIATLKDIVDISNSLTKTHRLEINEAVEARMLLLKAELDAAENESDRITLYKNTLDSLKEYYEWHQEALNAGRGTQLQLLRIKATRLEIEMILIQAETKEAKGGK